MKELQSVLDMTRRKVAGGSMLRIVTLSALLLLCAYQTITAARGDEPALPPADRQITYAFRQEVVGRALAYLANQPNKGPFFSPYRISKAYMSYAYSGQNLFCVSFEGTGFVTTKVVYVTYFYDKARNVHVKGVSRVDSDYREYCYQQYPLPEAVGRTLK